MNPAGLPGLPCGSLGSATKTTRQKPRLATGFAYGKSRGQTAEIRTYSCSENPKDPQDKPVGFDTNDCILWWGFGGDQR
jgi:hypothetical protein